VKKRGGYLWWSRGAPRRVCGSEAARRRWRIRPSVRQSVSTRRRLWAICERRISSLVCVVSCRVCVVCAAGVVRMMIPLRLTNFEVSAVRLPRKYQPIRPITGKDRGSFLSEVLDDSCCHPVLCGMCACVSSWMVKCCGSGSGQMGMETRGQNKMIFGDGDKCVATDKSRGRQSSSSSSSSAVVGDVEAQLL
jgi:hypothetical protein